MTPMHKVYSSEEGQHVWHKWTSCLVVGKVNMYDKMKKYVCMEQAIVTNGLLS